jgi:GcvH upstream region-like protein
MLNFLRKHQKVVFGVVSGALIVSIVFFGSYDAITSSQVVKEEDKVLGRALDGSTMSKLYLEKMGRFLSSDCKDMDRVYSMGTYNFFNDGVLKKDFFETEIASLILDSYFDEVKEGFAKSVEKQKRFKGYSHPAAPFLSSENLRQQFMPSLKPYLLGISGKEFAPTKQTFKSALELYMENEKMPSHFLRRFLSYQEGQYEWLAKDPYIANGDLSLFGFHTAEDWFGKEFIDLLSQVVLNASAFAKQKGYKVSFEEARADLFKNGYDALVSISEQEVTNEMVLKSFTQVLSSLRLTENEAIKIWQDVLTFRKMMKDYGESLFVDKLSLDQFSAYVSEAKEVQKYHLPKELDLQSFNDLMLFQTYLEIVAKHKKEINSLTIPSAFKSKQEILELAPTLVKRNYEIEYASVSLEDLEALISLKQMWQWQSTQENFEKIQSQFKQLKENKKLLSFEDLDALDEKSRADIDKFCIKQIAKENLSKIDELLEGASLEKLSLSLSKNGEGLKLEGIFSPSKFKERLDSIASFENKESAFFTYSEDQGHFYKVRLIAREEEERLLSFKQALEENILRDLLDEKLRKNHEAAQNANVTSFQNGDGTFKKFDQVRNEIGAYVFKELIGQMDQKFAKVRAKSQSKEEMFDFYANNRLYDYFKDAKEDIQKNLENSTFLNVNLPFHLEQSKEVVKRKDPTFEGKEEIFSLSDGSFSQVCMLSKGKPAFFKVIGSKNEPDLETLEKLNQEKQALASEAKRKLFSEILALIESSDSIHLEKKIEISHE